MSPIKLHLDTDIGGDLDDLCALALLLAWPDVKITGVTTVVENEGRRAGYAQHALNLAGQSRVPVAAGADASLECFREAYGLPPEERYWPERIPRIVNSIDAALDLLRASIDSGAIVVAIGPLTNLSLLERRSPGILGNATLCIMGGSVRPAPAGFPAWGFRDDFNLQADRLAAKHVLDSAGPGRVTLVPIEMTAQTALRQTHLPKLRRSDSLCRLIAHQAEAWLPDYRVAEQYAQACPHLPSDIINFQHDPLACAVALGWDGATVETLPLSIELEGEWLRERIDQCGKPTRVVTRIEPERFNTLWIDTVTRQGYVN